MMLRWLGRNLSTLLLAFILALVVWVSAVLSTDPNVEAVVPRAVKLEVIGLDPAYLQVANLPSQVRITLNAPQSIWSQLNAGQGDIRAWVDLSGLGEGEHVVRVNTQVTLNPVRVVSVEPAEIRVRLEVLTSRVMPVQLSVSGEPALGYRKGSPVIEPSEVTLTGPQSEVSKVAVVRAALDVSGVNDTVKKSVTLQALDQSGNLVSGVSILPPVVTVTQPIQLLGGYRNVVVKVVTRGQVAEGYWLTNISVIPPTVIVFSSDPQLVNDLPGFVETNPLDLSGLNDDVDVRATLNLPPGVTLAGEESVLVRLSIAALEGSLPISLPVEVVGLSPELNATISPEVVDLLLTGPLPILNNLTPASIRVSVNLSGLEVGTYQIAPVVDLLPSQVKVASILPASVEVVIEPAASATATGQGMPSPTPIP
jgi:YbbR domain-containing protein